MELDEDVVSVEVDDPHFVELGEEESKMLTGRKNELWRAADEPVQWLPFPGQTEELLCNNPCLRILRRWEEFEKKGRKAGNCSPSATCFG
jgi:hypothetical protein